MWHIYIAFERHVLCWPYTAVTCEVDIAVGWDFAVTYLLACMATYIHKTHSFLTRNIYDFRILKFPEFPYFWKYGILEIQKLCKYGN